MEKHSCMALTSPTGRERWCLAFGWWAAAGLPRRSRVRRLSTVGIRAAAALASRLAPSPAAAVTSLHVLRSRLGARELRSLFRAAGRLSQLTLVTERRVPCSVLAAAAAALTNAGSGDDDAVAVDGAWTHMRAFRLHCLAYDDDDDGDEACVAADAADAWARVLAFPTAAPLALLQLSADVPCGALLALRRNVGVHVADASSATPSSSSRTVLRLLRGVRDFTVDPLSGEIY
jgi:hypothetical protein